MIFKDKIKIKGCVHKITPPAKRQKPMLTIVKQKQTQVEKTVKPIPKAKSKTTLSPNAENLEVLITQLIQLFNKDWEKEDRIFVFLNSINQVDTTLDPLYIFITSLHKRNSTDPGDFVFST